MYEIKIVEPDPFDIMCSDCPVHDIAWWDGVDSEELRRIHKEQMEYEPTNPDFDAWLRQAIEEGWIRIAA